MIRSRRCRRPDRPVARDFETRPPSQMQSKDGGCLSSARTTKHGYGLLPNSLLINRAIHCPQSPSSPPTSPTSPTSKSSAGSVPHVHPTTGQSLENVLLLLPYYPTPWRSLPRARGPGESGKSLDGARRFFASPLRYFDRPIAKYSHQCVKEPTGKSGTSPET